MKKVRVTPSFHHSAAVLPLPFRRSAVVKFRCSIKITYENTAVNSKKIRNGSGNGKGNGVRKRQRLTGTAKRQRKNDNLVMETGHWADGAEPNWRKNDVSCELARVRNKCMFNIHLSHVLQTLLFNSLLPRSRTVGSIAYTLLVLSRLSAPVELSTRYTTPDTTVEISSTSATVE